MDNFGFDGIKAFRSVPKAFLGTAERQAVLSVCIMRSVPLFFRKGNGTVCILGSGNTNESYPQVAGDDLN